MTAAASLREGPNEMRTRESFDAKGARSSVKGKGD
jgi:hypothetical protein